MESKHVAPFHRLTSGRSSDAKKRTSGRFSRGGADGVAPRLCETRRERRTTPGTRVVRGFFWLATGGRNHDVLSVCTAGDRRRAADTGEISRKIVDTSHVGELELSAGAEAFCMNGRRNSALREHIVTDAAAGRNQPRRPSLARPIPISAGSEERRHAYPKQWLSPEPVSPEHDVAYFLSVARAMHVHNRRTIDKARSTLPVDIGASTGLRTLQLSCSASATTLPSGPRT